MAQAIAVPLGQPVINNGLLATAVTKSDTAVIGPTRSLYVGGTGDVAVVMYGDNTNTSVKFVAVPVGTILPINVAKVMSTGTTATNIVALM